jgi:hypothetical protein
MGLSRRGKKIVLGAGILTALLLAVAALRSRDLLVWYHRAMLRRDPGLMTAWQKTPPDSLQGEALREFLGTATGVRRLRQHIVEAVIGRAAKQDAGFLLQSLGPGRYLQFGLFDMGKGSYLFIEGPRTLFEMLPPESEILAWGPLLESLGNGDFELPEHPGVLFTIWTYREDSGRGPLVVECSMTRPGE